MDTALVSIIIPSFNRADLLPETLDSILAQTYTHWECLVIDDGSTDNTEAVMLNYCEKDQRIKFYKRPAIKPKGANACRNYGLELSQGSFINWFDSDDLMHQDKLRLQVSALEHNNYPFSVCQSKLFKDSINNILGLHSEQIISDNIFDDFLRKKIIIPIQAPLFRSKFIKENGFLFDEMLQAGQEWELFTRILFEHASYSVIETPLDYIRKHKNSISGDKSIIEKWYYTLARYKIHKRFKKHLSGNAKTYLRIYFLRMYRELLREHQLNRAFFVWRNYLIFEKSFTFKHQAAMIMALISFSVLRKGEYFLQKLKSSHSL